MLQSQGMRLFDPYQTLQLQPHASQDLVVEAYWTLIARARERAAEHGAASNAIGELNRAYRILIDDALRGAYDEENGLADLRPPVVRLVRTRNSMFGSTEEAVIADGSDYYRLLGVTADADGDIIDAAHRAMQRVCSGRTPRDECLRALLGEAHRTLAHPMLRAQYDAALSQAQPAGLPDAHAGHHPGESVLLTLVGGDAASEDAARVDGERRNGHAAHIPGPPAPENGHDAHYALPSLEAWPDGEEHPAPGDEILGFTALTQAHGFEVAPLPGACPDDREVEPTNGHKPQPRRRRLFGRTRNSSGRTSAARPVAPAATGGDEVDAAADVTQAEAAASEEARSDGVVAEAPSADIAETPGAAINASGVAADEAAAPSAGDGPPAEPDAGQAPSDGQAPNAHRRGLLGRFRSGGNGASDAEATERAAPPRTKRLSDRERTIEAEHARLLLLRDALPDAPEESGADAPPPRAAAAAPSGPRLEVGPDGELIGLGDNAITIGSSFACNVVLRGDDNIQPEHAYVWKHGASYALRIPEGATVRVNGEGLRVPLVFLEDGDEIAIGRYLVKFHAG